MIGWIGLGLLMFSYIILAISKFEYFLLIDIVASILLFIHSIQIQDIPITIVNAFIAIMLTINYIKVKRNGRTRNK